VSRQPYLLLWIRTRPTGGCIIHRDAEFGSRDVPTDCFSQGSINGLRTLYRARTRSRSERPDERACQRPPTDSAGEPPFFAPSSPRSRVKRSPCAVSQTQNCSLRTHIKSVQEPNWASRLGVNVDGPPSRRADILVPASASIQTTCQRPGNPCRRARFRFLILKGAPRRPGADYPNPRQRRGLGSSKSN
jgi:hypothetical protein